MQMEPDPKILEQKMAAGYAAFGGLLNSAMVYIGGELGLYRCMAELSEFSSIELAAKLGLSERFVREWLFQQAASGVIEYGDDGRFTMLPEAALVFADTDYPFSLAGALPYLTNVFSDAIAAREAFRSGLGRTYDDLGDDGARMTDALLGGWNRTALVSEALPRVEGAIERLQTGARVADIGCGAGAAVIAIASAFPASEVHGYDNSFAALRVAEEQRAAAGVANARFHNSDEEPLPDTPTFDLVTALDCLHDMARPDLAAAAVRRAIKPDGVWFIVDIDGAATLGANLDNPMAALLFATSVSTCLQSARSTADGLGSGTFGLPEPAMRKLVEDAGFTRFERVAGLAHPLNAYYQVRP
jgi:2-polyprenyl-3-methyl-5-hydroxy-6-metoxy-1,4-benzoquinol methylase